HGPGDRAPHAGPESIGRRLERADGTPGPRGPSKLSRSPRVGGSQRNEGGPTGQREAVLDLAPPGPAASLRMSLACVSSTSSTLAIPSRWAENASSTPPADDRVCPRFQGVICAV